MEQLKNKPKARIEIARTSECSEWPEAVNKAFLELVESARKQGFSVICAVGLSHIGEKHLSVQFSPSSSENPHIAAMSEDISELFRLVARRFRQ